MSRAKGSESIEGMPICSMTDECLLGWFDRISARSSRDEGWDGIWRSLRSEILNRMGRDHEES
jgi:hypothetical protein